MKTNLLKRTPYALIFIAGLSLLYFNTGASCLFAIEIFCAERSSLTDRESELVQLTFSQANLDQGRVRIINDKEIVYNGALYDIISIHRIKNHFIARIYRDEKEENILRRFQENLQNWLDGMAKHMLRVLKAFHIDIQVPSFHKFVFVSSYQRIFLPISNRRWQQPIVAVLKAPPDFCIHW